MFLFDTALEESHMESHETLAYIGQKRGIDIWYVNSYSSGALDWFLILDDSSSAAGPFAGG